MLIASLLLGAGVAGVPLDRPPADAAPVSRIVAALVQREPGAIVTAIEFDDNAWEADARLGDAWWTIDLSPKDGAEVRRRKTDAADELPPQNAKPLAEVLAALESEGVGVIEEVEFDDGLWNVEARKNGRKTTVKVDPVTGKRV